ncbi:MAG: hypothetical protein AAF513_12505 [Pseudomonadota bacterium]
MNKTIHTTIAVLAVVLWVVVGVASAPHVQAQEANNDAEKAAQNDAQKASEAKRETKPQDRNKTVGRGKKNEDREIFRPSEEISEDFAVPFPVDI